MFETYWETEKDKQMNKESNRLFVRCLGIFFGLFALVCIIAAIV